MSSFILLRLFSEPSGHSKDAEALRFREAELDKAESESGESVDLLMCGRVARESLMLEKMLVDKSRRDGPRSLLIDGVTIPFLVST